MKSTTLKNYSPEQKKKNQQIAQKWLKWAKALRSGKYQQATGDLRNKNGYCCLGVCAEIFLGKKWKFDEDVQSYSIKGACSYLPDELTEMLNLNDQGRIYFKNGNFKTTLVDLNDDKKYNFKQIAAVIEDAAQVLVKENRNVFEN